MLSLKLRLPWARVEACRVLGIGLKMEWANFGRASVSDCLKTACRW